MTEIRGLRTLARLHGVQSTYHDADGQRRQSSPESLLAVLEAFGAPIHSARDVPSAMRDRRLAQWRRVTPFVTVVWEGSAGLIELRLPLRSAERTVRGMLSLEDGRELPVTWDLRSLTPSLAEEVEGESFSLYRLALPEQLPIGYHRLTTDAKSGDDSTLVISAPVRCAPGPAQDWGLFLPLYALRSAYDWGTGDYAMLAELSRWAASLGASTVGTLPLLPTFLDDPFEPSPYAPVSRLAWNPLFVDVLRAPGAGDSAGVGMLYDSLEMSKEIEKVRALPEVDYRRVMALKRRALEELAGSQANAGAIATFARERPVMDAYAKFMATKERQGKPWPQWPERLRQGALEERDYDQRVWRYHLYGQMAAAGQMDALSKADGGAGLYLDYPVGVHPDGFDVWREQERFVTDVTVGAPPDPFFSKGQDWGFNPLHPERAADHAYFIASLRHHMEHASLLRLDHVMGLHRLYWVPRGAGATNGAYVRYPAEEMYAVLAIESHRHAAGVVGEDLGTVPPVVPRSMARHGLKRMFVLQFSVSPDAPRPVGWPSRGMVASINTHDTPTFAGYWRGLDIDDRHDLGLLDEPETRAAKVERERAGRVLVDWLRKRGYLEEEASGEEPVMRAIYSGLATSKADLVLVNLEDLWLEPKPHNLPGTSTERPNWRRKARYTVEEFTSQDSIRTLLAEITRLRRRNANERGDSPERDRSD